MAGSGESAIHVWRAFVRAKAAIRRTVHRELREHGLTGSQLDILRVLADSGADGVKLNDISQRLFVTSGNVTGLIDRLEQAGYLARVAHPQDRRVTLAVLTPTGRELFERLHPSYLDRIKSLMSTLTAKEQAVLADLLGRVADRATDMDA